MRIQQLLLIPLAMLSVASLLPPDAHAAKIPVCTQMHSRQPCYVYDPSDCIVVDGQEYCRTVLLYRWEV
jgi:hypothetical protein